MSARWVLPTLRGYRASWLVGDGLAGLALVAVALPSQMATAHLANLPVVVGLYAFLAGSLAYALLGENLHLSVGADSTIAPVLATGVGTLAAAGTSQYAGAMAVVALMVGALLIVIGLCRLGWIAEFLSTPVITGVLGGIAVEIVVRELPIVLGLPARGSTTIGMIRGVVDGIGHTNAWSLGIAAGVFAVIAVTQRIDRRLPGALLALILSIVIVEVLDLGGHGVALVGAVHGGPPHVGLPATSWSQLRSLATTALTVTFLCTAQTAATVRTVVPDVPTINDFNRDLIGIGAGNVAAGLIGALAVDTSPPNTAIATASGSRTQLTGVTAALAVLAIMLTATGPLAHLPEATLGATLIFIATKLFRASELRNVLRFDRIEFGLAVTSLLAVSLIGIEQGVALAMILSLADRTRRTARPIDTILGRERHTDHWIPVDIGSDTTQTPGVLVYLVYAPLWYGNADYLRQRIRHLVDAASTPVTAVIMDANGMSDIDYTGLQALRGLATELSMRGITIGIARSSHVVHHDLKRGALLGELGPLFASVEDAVSALHHQP